MIAVDTNLLVYAHRQDSAFHARARDCLVELAGGRGAWAIPWHCLHEFFAVVTHRRAYAMPTPPAMAMTAIEAWLAAPNLHLLHETSAHWTTLSGLIQRGKVVGPMVHDARIAALCLQHGVRELWSADRDFKRFPELTVRNPLVG